MSSRREPRLSLFRCKRHYLLNALDDEVMMVLLRQRIVRQMHFESF